MTDFDIVIVGAGIAGASLAYELSGHSSILLIEAEAQPGYHATGRSAAFWTESYGGPYIQPLTTASGPFLARPPVDFSTSSFLFRRGALHIGRDQDWGSANRVIEDFAGSDVHFDRLDRPQIEGHVPGILPEWGVGLWEPECCDIDVAALHAAYLRNAKRNGVQFAYNAAMENATFENGRWEIETRSRLYTSKLLVNASGAWADEVANRAKIKTIGIKAYRRTVVQLNVEPAAPKTLPLVIALDGSFYFKPDSGKLWLSPHDETLSPPCDAVPEEMDVAEAVDRFQKVVDWRILKLDHKWAGLRSFAPDRLPVIGRDPDIPEYFWFVGQGGFGIQTAPAAARLAASLLCDQILPPDNVEPSRYEPARLRYFTQ